MVLSLMEKGAVQDIRCSLLTLDSDTFSMLRATVKLFKLVVRYKLEYGINTLNKRDAETSSLPIYLLNIIVCQLVHPPPPPLPLVHTICITYFSNSEANGLGSIDLARSLGVLLFEGQDVQGAQKILDYLMDSYSVVLE